MENYIAFGFIDKSEKKSKGPFKNMFAYGTNGAHFMGG